jgi:ketosteroid isomerase-like protein
MSELTEAATRHVERFNKAVRTGDFSDLVDTFAPTAVMRFIGVPAGPYVGRASIAQAYADSPPDDTMSIVDVHEAGPCTVQASFAWTRGGTGSMTMSYDNGAVIDLTICFD